MTSAGRSTSWASSCRPSRRATGLPWEHEAERRGEKVEQLDILGVFATQATVRSRVYEIEIDKRKQDLAVFSEACPELVPLIEGDRLGGRAGQGRSRATSRP